MANTKIVLPSDHRLSHFEVKMRFQEVSVNI